MRAPATKLRGKRDIQFSFLQYTVRHAANHTKMKGFPLHHNAAHVIYSGGEIVSDKVNLWGLDFSTFL
jgi:hypothetical protein